MTDPEAAVMAHAATLGGFSMYNSGGCWDDAPINRHASWWVMDDRLNQGNQPDAYKPRWKMSGKVGLGYFGALYSAYSMLLEHARLGSIALGCKCEKSEDTVVVTPDPCFGLRLCDLERGYALVSEGAEMEQVTIFGKTVHVRVKPLDHQEAHLRVRRGTPGEWLYLQETGENEYAFVIRDRYFKGVSR